MIDITQKLAKLYKTWCGERPRTVTKLAGSGSYRTYYRICGEHGSVIGAHNNDVHENRAFKSFTRHFHSHGLPVPEILADDPENRMYLISDLGDMTLYQLLTLKRFDGASAQKQPLKPIFNTNQDLSQNDHQEDYFPAEILGIYKKSLSWLPVFQIKAAESLDYSACYPRAAFDGQSMRWDLNYFKYYFLKLARIPFDEQALENDFSSLCDLLLEADSDFFLFRDFQSRNIMVVYGEPWFIDYQGGRKGALQYDVASLLYDAKANISEPDRNLLLDYYLEKLGEIFPVNREKFLKTYYGFVLIRILQALGAYGFRGYYENKPHFLQSIPYALHNLNFLRTNHKIDFNLRALMSVIDRMVNTPVLYDQQYFGEKDNMYETITETKSDSISSPFEKILTVTIHSFSYKKQVPEDESGNGGGYVFDCRALPNPGRYEEFKIYNGQDQSVVDFLKKEPSVGEFLHHTFSLVDQSIRTYIDRGFEHLQVSYGCTGGQHRSVFCAEELAKYLRTKYNIVVNLVHSESFRRR